MRALIICVFKAKAMLMHLSMQVSVLTALRALLFQVYCPFTNLNYTGPLKITDINLIGSSRPMKNRCNRFSKYPVTEEIFKRLLRCQPTQELSIIFLPAADHFITG